jgi:hypothetical protein
MRWVLVAFLATGCTRVHHISVGPIDDTTAPGKRIEVHLSDTGINMDTYMGIANVIGSVLGGLDQAVMGPITGSAPTDAVYAMQLAEELHAQCPRGRVKNVVVRRITHNLGLSSDESVVLEGVCVTEIQEG